MGKLLNSDILQSLQEKFGDRIFGNTEPYGLLTFETNASAIEQVLYHVKTDSSLQFNFLTDITAVHYPEQEKREFAVVYHLHSFVNNIRMRIKVFLDKKSLNIPSATPLWEGANWMERETFDFFGIQFNGHPDLRRILNVDDMTVFRMGKTVMSSTFKIRLRSG